MERDLNKKVIIERMKCQLDSDHYGYKHPKLTKSAIIRTIRYDLDGSVLSDEVKYDGKVFHDKAKVFLIEKLCPEDAELYAGTISSQEFIQALRRSRGLEFVGVKSLFREPKASLDEFSFVLVNEEYVEFKGQKFWNEELLRKALRLPSGQPSGNSVSMPSSSEGKGVSAPAKPPEKKVTLPRKENPSDRERQMTDSEIRKAHAIAMIAEMEGY